MAIDFNKFGKGSSSAGQNTPVASSLSQQTQKSSIDFNKFGKSAQSAQTTIPEQSDGFIKGMVKAPLTIAARPIQAAIVGSAQLFGGNKAAEQTQSALDTFSRDTLGGYVAPIPRTAADVKKDVGRAAQTVSYGTGGLLRGGALFGAGSSLEKGNNLFSEETAVESALSAGGAKLAGVIGKPIAKKVGQFAEKIAPGITETVGDIGRNIGAKMAQTEILPGSVKTAVKSGAEMVKPLFAKPVEIAKKLTEKSEKELEADILTRFNKATKPSVAGKINQGQVGKYEDKVIQAAKTINENKGALSFADDSGNIIKGETPQSLRQLSESVAQSKRNIFNKYNTMAREAGDAGLQIQTDDVVKELDNFINNKSVQATNPQAISYAQKVKEFYLQNPNLSPEIVEDIIASNNTKLNNFMSGRATDQSSSVAVDAMLTNILRNNLDNGIARLEGPGYQALKNQYGALSAIEKDVVKASLRDANKNVGGNWLNAVLDANSGGQLAYGIINANPGALASAAAQKAITAVYKHYNNPNRAIKKMFESVSKLQAPKSIDTTKLLRLEAKNPERLFVTPQGKISPIKQEASDLSAVETGIAKSPRKIKDILGTEPKKKVDRTGGFSPIKTLASGSAIAGSAVGIKSKLNDIFEKDSKGGDTKQVDAVQNKPKVVKQETMPKGMVVTTLDNGEQVSEIHPNIKKDIPAIYEKYPNLPKGILEALLMKESTSGYNDENRNPKIGKYAWIGGIAGEGGARDEFKRMGIKVDLNTIPGVLDAMAKYWTILQDRKGNKDPIELYKKGYSSGKLSKEDIDKFETYLRYFSG